MGYINLLDLWPLLFASVIVSFFLRTLSFPWLVYSVTAFWHGRVRSQTRQVQIVICVIVTHSAVTLGTLLLGIFCGFPDQENYPSV